MIVLGIGDFGATSDSRESLKTIGLGSCVAVVCSDPGIPISGLIHVVLPDSVSANDGRAHPPGYFADTGLPLFFRAMAQVGYQPGRGALGIRLVGGANVMDPGGTFNIGGRNAVAIRRILKGMGLTPIAEDLGGAISRSVTVETSTGKVRVSSPGLPPWEL